MNAYWAISESKRYVVGPMAVIGFGYGFSVEVDALYRRVGYRTRNPDPFGGSSTARARGNSWEFPMVLRKTVGLGIYGAVGYAPRAINGSEHSDLLQVNPSVPGVGTHLEFDIPGRWRTTNGIVAGGGMERRIGRLRIAPEIRYVYWTTPALEEYGSRGFNIISSQHQVDVLIGITWH